MIDIPTDVGFGAKRRDWLRMGGSCEGGIEAGVSNRIQRVPRVDGDYSE